MSIHAAADAARYTQAVTAADALEAERGNRIAKAGAILLAASSETHPKLASMLRICAGALETHPEPAHLCRANADRLNATLKVEDPQLAPGMNAVHVVIAADAFDAAADALAVR